jgi:hypothetical protein
MVQALLARAAWYWWCCGWRTWEIFQSLRKSSTGRPHLSMHCMVPKISPSRSAFSTCITTIIRSPGSAQRFALAPHQLRPTRWALLRSHDQLISGSRFVHEPCQPADPTAATTSRAFARLMPSHLCPRGLGPSRRGEGDGLQAALHVVLLRPSAPSQTGQPASNAQRPHHPPIEPSTPRKLGSTTSQHSDRQTSGEVLDSERQPYSPFRVVDSSQYG